MSLPEDIFLTQDREFDEFLNYRTKVDAEHITRRRHHAIPIALQTVGLLCKLLVLCMLPWLLCMVQDLRGALLLKGSTSGG